MTKTKSKKMTSDTTLSLKQQKKIADEYNELVQKWTIDVPQEILSNKKRFEDLVKDINKAIPYEVTYADFAADLEELILNFEESIECIEMMCRYSHIED
jgi:DNA-binding HxlR family transcriptional regulator